MITDINSEDRLGQQTFTENLEEALASESLYAYKAEPFGPTATLAGPSERDVVLAVDLRAALGRPTLNEQIARDRAIEDGLAPATYCCRAS